MAPTTPFRYGNRFQNKLAKYEGIYGAGNYGQRDPSQGFTRRFLARAGQYRQMNPLASQTTTSTATPEPAPPAAPNPLENKGLFPGAMAFEPSRYEASPLYQWQKQQMTKDLDQTLAARGLTNSGAELELKQNAFAQLAANEAERARSVSQQEADRYERMSENQANRTERGGNEQFDRAYNILNLLMQQNPYNSGVSANDTLAKLILQNAQRRGSQQGGLYARAGGGGGGGFVPNFSALGPDYSLANAASAQASANQSSMWSNLINGLISNLGKQ